MQNYFAEQPSGRNLLQVTDHSAASQAAAARRRTAARNEGASARPQRNWGMYQEEPSGRELMRSFDGDSDTASRQAGEEGVIRGAAAVGPRVHGHERDEQARAAARSQQMYQGQGQESTSSSYYSESDTSSRWEEDSDAQSHAYPTSRSGSGRSGFGIAVAGRQLLGGEAAEARSSHMVHQPFSPGSEAASRMPESSVGVDRGVFDSTGSSVSRRFGDGGDDEDSEDVLGELPTPRLVERLPVELHNSGSSSIDTSRISSAELHRASTVSNPIPEQESWQSSENEEDMPLSRRVDQRYLNSDAASGFGSSLGESQVGSYREGASARTPHRGESPGSDFGTAWLANRAQSRHYDDDNDQDSDRR